jgi:STIP1 family protein 1
MIVCFWKSNKYQGQAQFELHHPNEALSSALRAYEICSVSSHQTSSAFPISTFVLKCKKAKWDLREQDRLRRRNPLLGELERKLIQDKDAEIALLHQRASNGEIGNVTLMEESESIESACSESVNDLRNVFAIADPDNLTPRVSALEASHCGTTNRCTGNPVPSY